MRIIVMAIAALFLIKGANAQSCTQVLRLANATYEQGRLHDIEGILKDCLEGKNGGFTKQEKVQAYKVLCLSFLYLEEPQKANEAMLSLLKTDPYFEVNENVDPAEFVGLYKTFRTWPIYRIGAKLGVNASRPNVASKMYILNGTSEYKPIIDFHFGAAGEILINKKIVINPEIHYQRKSFAYLSEVDFGTNPKSSEGFEKQVWLSLPVLVQYNWTDLGNKKGKTRQWSPFAGLGASFDYLTNPELTISRLRQSASQINEQKFKINPMREPINTSIVTTAGIKYSLGGGYFIAEVRYLYGLMKVNSEKTSYENYFLALDYAYVDNPYKLAGLSFSIGYVHNVFKPMKLNKGQ